VSEETEDTMEQIRAFFNYIGEFNAVSVLLRVFLSVIAGGVIGYERDVTAGRRVSARICWSVSAVQ